MPNSSRLHIAELHCFRAPREDSDGARNRKDEYTNDGGNFVAGAGACVVKEVTDMAHAHNERRDQERLYKGLMSFPELHTKLLKHAYLDCNRRVDVPNTTAHDYFRQIGVLVPPPRGHPPSTPAFAMLSDLMVRGQCERCIQVTYAALRTRV